MPDGYNEQLPGTEAFMCANSHRVVVEDRLGDEERAALEAMEIVGRDLTDIPQAREAAAQRLDPLPRSTKGVDVSDVLITTAGRSELRIRLYRPDGVESPLPALLWMHGGGLVMGRIDWDDEHCAHLTGVGGCLVVSVDYRLAPEHPYPEPLKDCSTALAWLVDQADELAVDKTRIAVGGASAGAGLAAAVALWARDHGGPQIVWQLLVYPMLDDRNLTISSQRITHPKLWNRKNNILAWNAYLSGRAGQPGVPQYAAPARAENLSDLPPAYIAVGDMDLFVDENISYAQRLLACDVATELHVYPGAFHGSDLVVPDSKLSRRWIADRDHALRRALYAHET